MRQQIQLFIEDKEVEFSQPPQIFYNYTETDLRNPTAVKNSFSKTIEIEGTPDNNDIFGHIWNLERYQDYGGGGGPAFNPSQKADFKLFVNAELYEKGYCKLDNIVRTKNNVVYHITLYGGLGSLFSNLSTKDGDSNMQKTLADLQYPFGYMGADLDLSFQINKDTVNEAWEELEGVTDDKKKWDMINFAVTAEGIPEDFDADKVLINGADNGMGLLSQSGDYYTVRNGNIISGGVMGYTLAELKNSLTSDAAFDLRSYLLRPVISVRHILDAIANPANNGGYKLDYDSHFFNPQNPYYWNAWMTLPRLRELTENIEAAPITTASLVKDGDNYYNVNYSTTYNPNNVEITFNVTTNASSSAAELWSSRRTHTNAWGHSGQWYVKNFDYAGGLAVTLQALDGGGNIIAESDTILCLSSYKTVSNNLAKLYTEHYGGNVQTIYGHYEKKNGVYTFVNGNGQTINLKLSLSSPIEFSSLRIKMTNPETQAIQYTWGIVDAKENKTDYDILPASQHFYTESYGEYSGNHYYDDVLNYHSVQGTYGLSLVSVYGEREGDYGLFSNTYISKEVLLQTDYTPAQFLLSYAKLFGLYFFMNPNEEASDIAKYPNGVVHLMDRDSFYTEEVVDINEDIDRSKPITINPRTAESKWYSFAYQEGDSEAEERYRRGYGYGYGRQLINTQSNFNNDTKELYEDSIFKNGIQVQEKSGYYIIQPTDKRGYLFDGFTYHLYKKDNNDYDTVDINFPQKKLTDGVYINEYGMPYFDSIPKLQVHNIDKEEGDGSGILLFFDNFANLTDANGNALNYYLTDDVADMVYLNDGQPCWLYTRSEVDGDNVPIAIRRTTLPFFTRDIYDEGRRGNIIHSWNFGHPAETYVPKSYTTDYDSIYDNCWKDYIGDLYNNNTRIVSAFLRFETKPNPDWLRRYYWWDNSIWRINRITDWNCSSFDSSEVEFIKIQDMDNYTLEPIYYSGRLRFVIDQSSIASSGGVITGRILQQSNAAGWAFTDTYSIAYNNGTTGGGYTSSVIIPTTGSASRTELTITIPQNNSVGRTFTFKLRDAQDNLITGSIYQDGYDVSSLAFNPSTYYKNYSAGLMRLTFDADNIDLSSLVFTSEASWITFSAYSGTNAVLVSVTKNNSTSDRTGTVTLAGTSSIDSASHQASAAIVQRGMEQPDGTLTLDESAATVSSAAGSYDFGYVITDINPAEVQVVVYEGTATTCDWCSGRVDSATSTIYLDYTLNDRPSSRQCTVWVNAYDYNGNFCQGYFYLTQNASPQPPITASPDALEWTYLQTQTQSIGVSGGTLTYNITEQDN